MQNSVRVGDDNLWSYMLLHQVCIKKTLKIPKKVRELVTYGEEGSGPDRGQRQKQEFSKSAFYIILIFEPC